MPKLSINKHKSLVEIKYNRIEKTIELTELINGKIENIASLSVLSFLSMIGLNKAELDKIYAGKIENYVFYKHNKN